MKLSRALVLGLVSTLGCGGAGAKAPPRATETRAAQITVTEIGGTTPERTGVLFAPAHDSLETCRGATGGKLRVRVHTKADGTLGVEAEPGSSLDPQARRCVLDALQGASLTDLANAGGPVIKPTGFTAIVTVEW